VVPHERPDAVAVLEAELAERDDELLRARDEVGVGARVPALVRRRLAISLSPNSSSARRMIAGTLSW
jgi:hypothetical protein